MPEQPCSRPAATPCREGLGLLDDMSLDEIPDISDMSIEKPKAGALRVSADAVEGRLRRLFTPNTKGDYKVSSEIVNQWKSKKGKKSLQQLFQSVGFNTDWLEQKYTGSRIHLNLVLFNTSNQMFPFSCCFERHP